MSLSRNAPLKLTRCPHSLAALPSMSLIPFAPFPHSRRVLCRFSQKLHSISRFAHLCRSIPVGFIRGNCERSEAVTSLKRLHSVSVAYSVTSGSHTSLAAAEANDFESPDPEDLIWCQIGYCRPFVVRRAAFRHPVSLPHQSWLE